ncbi:hypothetical protein K2173_013175 [Erythroxylum novogranatense]|uniref:DDE Tnp4 domain-containing protein n=1 Tax=Erythroxylum novogranatense TaxID=1862640 RepID=A0AAV8TEX2_9ROSI|nr:hypothetical protein K2173_013175 [Erythroxylum novogranatense]
MQFIYVLLGWEGSVADARVLRDALSRRNGLPIRDGYYYLVDVGYTNDKGFLAPFRGQRYHLNDWNPGYQPNTPEELFNMKHSSDRNVIERCFGLLKVRWHIIRNSNWYPIKLQSKIIMACCLLHNHLRRNMPIDPAEVDLDAEEEEEENEGGVGLDGEPITSVEPSEEWINWRQTLANQMFDEWRQNRNNG